MTRLSHVSDSFHKKDTILTLTELRNTEMKTAAEYLRYWGLEKAFSGVSENELSLKAYKDGENLFLAGQDVRYAYLLVEGRCRLYGLSKEGKEVLVNFKEALGIFGDMEILLGIDFQLSMAAWGGAMVLRIPKSLMEKKLLYQVDFLRFLSRELADKMCIDSAQQIQSILKGGKSRAAHRLCLQAQAEGKNSFLFSCRATARDAVISERQLSRVLVEWVEEGIIKRDGRQIRITDMDRLKKLSGDM